MVSFMIGRSEIGTADGWRETDRTEDRLNLVSPDGQHHATISVMQFASDLTFDEFKKLCEIRYKVERRLLIDGFIEAWQIGAKDKPKPRTVGQQMSQDEF